MEKTILKPTAFGVDATYRKISEIKIDVVAGKIYLKVGLYATQEAQVPLDTTGYSFDLDQAKIGNITTYCEGLIASSEVVVEQ